MNLTNFEEMVRPKSPDWWLKLRYCLWIAILQSALAASASPLERDPGVEQLKALSIEELLDIPLVYGASRHSQKITEAPSSISIVTADEIRKFGYRTLADVLRGVGGFYVNYDRAYGYIGVRGFNRPGDFGGRVLVLVDGHRINDTLYDSAPIVDDFILDIDLIERVEIIRGPSFSLYGANAFFGGINVITRKGRAVHGVEGAGRAASLASYQGRLTAGERLANGAELLFSASKQTSAGHADLFVQEYNQPANNHGHARNLDGSGADRLFGSLSWNGLTLRSGFVSRNKDIPTAPYPDSLTSYNEPGTNYLDQRSFLDASYQHAFDSGWEIKGRLYYDWYNFQGHYARRDPTTRVRLIERDPSSSQWWGAELQASKQIFEQHRLLGAWSTRTFSVRDSGAMTA